MPDVGHTTQERQAAWFTTAILAVCLLLQRFALPVAGRTLSIVGPIGLGMLAFGLYRGFLRIDRTRLVIFLALTVLILAGAFWQVISPAAISARAASGNSILLFLSLTSFATVSFAAEMDEALFFRRVTLALLIVAFAGILQFAAQFAGLRLFSFTGLLPATLLNEATYHLEIPAGFGDLLKSNGLVLIEPSVFSQFMALGLIIEVIGLRRTVAIAGFAAGLLLSFSGTGWIVLAAFVLASALGLGWRGLAIAGGVMSLLIAVLGAAALISPDAFGALAGRLGEINQPGTSGHMRFITPFWMLGDVFSATPSASLFGIGSGRGELLTLPYDYAVNTATKVTVEYGVPALAAYVLLFVAARRTRMQGATVLPCLVLFLFTGGYQEFAPILFLVLLLTVVARLRAGKEIGRAPPSPAAAGSAA